MNTCPRHSTFLDVPPPAEPYGRRGALGNSCTLGYKEGMAVSVKLPPKRNLCGTAEAAEIYGCRVSHIRGMAIRAEIWSEQVSQRTFVYDADEIRRLAAERDRLRQAGKLCGRRPSGRKSA